MFLCEVVHLAETATRPNTREASSSSADFYGFHDSESDNDTESASKIEGLQFLSDPSHNVDWFLPKKICSQNRCTATEIRQTLEPHQKLSKCKVNVTQ